MNDSNSFKTSLSCCLPHQCWQLWSLFAKAAISKNKIKAWLWGSAAVAKFYGWALGLVFINRLPRLAVPMLGTACRQSFKVTWKFVQVCYGHVSSSKHGWNTYSVRNVMEEHNIIWVCGYWSAVIWVLQRVWCTYLNQHANNGNAKALVPRNNEDISIPAAACFISFRDGILPRIIRANCKSKTISMHLEVRAFTVQDMCVFSLSLSLSNARTRTYTYTLL
jgi:hypothetical protein